MRQIIRLGLALAFLIAPAARAQQAIDVNVGGRPKPQPVAPPVVIMKTLNGASRRLTLEPARPSAPAADDDDEEDDGLRLPIPRAQALGINLNTAVLERENFDRWVFGPDLTEASRREHLEQLLMTKEAVIARRHRLTAEQRAKIHLAGQGDIKHFLDRVAERRSEFDVVRKNFRAGQRFLLGLEASAEEYRRGPFDGGSLFMKMAKKFDDESKGSR